MGEIALFFEKVPEKERPRSPNQEETGMEEVQEPELRWVRDHDQGVCSCVCEQQLFP